MGLGPGKPASGISPEAVQRARLALAARKIKAARAKLSEAYCTGFNPVEASLLATGIHALTQLEELLELNHFPKGAKG